MIDFLTFKSFISIDFFILLYYIGAVIIPVLILYNYKYLIDNFKLFRYMHKSAVTIFDKLNQKEKNISIACMFFCFIFMEIMWRVCFEMIIGYFQLIESAKVLSS